MKVKLAEGRALRDPDTKALMNPDVVRDVPTTGYWRRRLRDGDVVEVGEEHHHRRPRGEHEGDR